METEKQNSARQICLYVLEQLQAKTQQELSTLEMEILEVYCLNLDYQETAQILKMAPRTVLRTIYASFRKLNIGETLPVFKSCEDFLYAPLFFHGLSARLYHGLRSLDCSNFKEVLLLDKKELMSKRGFGKKSFFELKEYIEKSGWTVKAEFTK